MRRPRILLSNYLWHLILDPRFGRRVSTAQQKSTVGNNQNQLNKLPFPNLRSDHLMASDLDLSLPPIQQQQQQ